jgi:hypothetical protein
MTSPPAEEFRAAFASSAGGVMTEEAGAITGELEILCRPEAGRLQVAVRYAGTDDWYTVSGGPLRVRDAPGSVEGRILQHLRTPGPVVDGNEEAITLERFPEA